MIYVPGLLTGRLSGLAGNTLASLNQWAAFIGVNKGRINTKSAPGRVLRARFGAIAYAFRTLTSGQLLDWQTLGDSITVTGRLDRVYSLRASATFHMVNANRHTLGEPITLIAPTLDLPTFAPTVTFTVEHTP